MNQTLDCCLYFGVSKLNRIITKMAEEEFKKVGLSPTYGFLILAVEKNQGISPTEIAKELHMTPSTITRFIDKLEKSGYIIRQFEGKYASIYTTKEGTELIPEINEAWHRIYSRYSEILGYEEGANITRFINDITDKLI